MRGLVGAALVAALVGTSATAAPPDVQQAVSGSAEIYVLGNDRRVHRILIHASVVDGVATTPYSSVHLWISRCAGGQCGKPVYYQDALTSAQYDARDDTRWWIKLSAFGKPFTVTWTGSGRNAPVEDVAVGGYDVYAGAGWAATATVTILGRTCTATAAGASRGVVVWGNGRPRGSDSTRIPSRAVAGQPSSATSCRKGP